VGLSSPLRQPTCNGHLKSAPVHQVKQELTYGSAILAVPTAYQEGGTLGRSDTKATTGIAKHAASQPAIEPDLTDQHITNVHVRFCHLSTYNVVVCRKHATAVQNSNTHLTLSVLLLLPLQGSFDPFWSVAGFADSLTSAQLTLSDPRTDPFSVNNLIPPNTLHVRD
jgi:hypothetical protein